MSIDLSNLPDFIRKIENSPWLAVRIVVVIALSLVALYLLPKPLARFINDHFDSNFTSIAIWLLTVAIITIAILLVATAAALFKRYRWELVAAALVVLSACGGYSYYFIPKVSADTYPPSDTDGKGRPPPPQSDYRAACPEALARYVKPNPPYAFAKTCYEAARCRATLDLCHAFGDGSPTSAACAAGAPGLSDNERATLATDAETNGCLPDALAWLAGMSDAQRREDHLARVLFVHCGRDEVNAADPVIVAVAARFSSSIACPR